MIIDFKMINNRIKYKNRKKRNILKKQKIKLVLYFYEIFCYCCTFNNIFIYN